MMNLWELLKVFEGLPLPDFETPLFSEKFEKLIDSTENGHGIRTSASPHCQ